MAVALIVQRPLPAPLPTDSQVEAPPEEKIGISQVPLRDPFRNLQDVFLKLEQFKNDSEVVFPGRLVLEIATDFINPKGTLLSAIRGISIRSGLYRNKGVILSPQGGVAVKTGDFNNNKGYLECSEPLKIEAKTGSNKKGILTASAAEVAVYGKYDQTQGTLSGHQGVKGRFGTFVNAEEGKVLSPDGLVEIACVDDLTQNGIIKASNGIVLTSEHGLWSENGLLLTPNKKIVIKAEDLLFKDVQAVAKELEINGQVGEFTNVDFATQGPQIIEVSIADFIQVRFRAQEGEIELITSESGSYEECTVFSGGDSIAYRSDGLLYFQSTSTMAKKTIVQEALDLVDHESSHVAEGNVTQFADVLDSYYSLLSSKETVSIDVKDAHTTGLTLIAKDFQGDCIEEGQFSKSRVRVEGQATWTSQTKYIDLTGSELTFGNMTVHALLQIFLQKAQLQLRENAEFVSREGWIDANQTSMKAIGPSQENSEVLFEAPQGTVYLNQIEMQGVPKLTAKGESVAVEESAIGTIKDVTIEGNRVAGRESVLVSEKGNIGLEGHRSLLLNKMQKRAVHGQIRERSNQWISEENNENQSLEIARSSAQMSLVRTTDAAKKIHLATTERLQTSEYQANGKESVVVDAEGTAVLEKSGFSAPTLGIRGDDLWLREDNFQFNQLEVKSQALEMTLSEAKGKSSHFEVVENSPVFSGNDLRTKVNVIKSGKGITFTHNTVAGAQTFTSESDQRIADNSFANGDLQFESKGGNTHLQDNRFVDNQTLQMKNPQGAAQLENVKAEFETLKVEAQNIGIEKSDIVADTSLTGVDVRISQSHLKSEESILTKASQNFTVVQSTLEAEGAVVAESKNSSIEDSVLAGRIAAALKSVQANVIGSSFDSPEGEVNIAIDRGTILDSTFKADQDVTVQGEKLDVRDSELHSKNKAAKTLGDELRLTRVSLQGNDVVQQAEKLTNIDVAAIAVETVERQAKTLLTVDGEDRAKEVVEKAEEAVISGRKIIAQESITQEIGQGLLDRNTSKAPQIAIQGERLIGSQNHFEGALLSVQADRLNLPLTTAKVDRMQFAGKDELALPMSVLEGDVVMEHGSPSQTARPAADYAAGFSNLSANCWANSLLSMIVSVPSLRQAYDTVANYHAEKNVQAPSQIHGAALQNAMRAYNTALGEKRPVFSDATQGVRLAFHHLFGQINPLTGAEVFSAQPYAHEDAYEAMQMLMGEYERILREQNPHAPPFSNLYARMESRRRYQPTGAEREADPLRVAQDDYSRLNPDNASVVSHNDYQILLDLQNRGDLNFDTLLSQYFKNTDVENAEEAQYLLPNGKVQNFKLTEESRQFMHSPDELILTLKRFGADENGRGYKIVAPVEIRRRIALPPEATLENKPIPYELDAFILHRGGIGAGHYVCYKKIQQRWIEADDGRVRFVEENEIDQILQGRRAAESTSYMHHYTRFAEDQEDIQEQQVADEPTPQEHVPSLPLDIARTTVVGSLQVRSKGNVDGPHLHVEGKALSANGENLWLPDMHADVSGNIRLGAQDQAHVMRASLTSSEESIAVVSNHLHGSEIQVNAAKKGDFHTEGFADLRNAQAEIGESLNLGGKHLNLDGSNFSAHSIGEYAEMGISAVESSHVSQTTLIQAAEGGIDLENSSSEASEKILRQAGGYINHKGAESEAPSQSTRAEFLDNQGGALAGDQLIQTDIFNNQNGALKLGAGVSHIKTGQMLTDSSSQVTGKGSVSIQTEGRHHEMSRVNIGGAYQLEAEGALLDSAIKANTIQINTFQQPTALTEKATLSTKELTSINCSRLDNQGSIQSEKDIAIHQTHYQDPGSVSAGNLLFLSTDSSFELIKMMRVLFSLAVKSKQTIRIRAPIVAGGDIYLDGNLIDILNRISAAGRGVFFSKTDVNVDHTQVSLGNGIDVQARRFLIRVSDIDVVGESAINTIAVEVFRLEGEVEVPIASNTRKSYTHRPSNFRLKGDLALKATLEAVNLGSNMLVDGDGYLSGKNLENLNFEHLYSYQVETGKVHKRRFGFRCGSKTLTATRHVIVVDGWGNTQFKKTAHLNFDTFRNNGVFLAGGIKGRVSHLLNGIFSKIGQTPTLDPQSLPRLPGLPTPRPGGDIQANGPIELEGQTAHNTGYISGDVVDLEYRDRYINEKRVIEEQEDAIKKRRSFGKTSTERVTTDHVQPGGETSGRAVRLRTDYGANRGGLFSGRDVLNIEGNDLDNEALTLRSVNPVNHFAKTSFHRAQMLSGDLMGIRLQRRLRNTASDIISWGQAAIIAGEFVQRNLFAANVEVNKRGLGKRRKLHSIEMEEGRTVAVAGPLSIQTTQSNIDIEGEAGSYQGHLTLDSAEDVLFRARTVSVQNRISSWKASFAQFSQQSTTFNTTQSSLPHVFAGNGATIKCKTLFAEGLQAEFIGDVRVKASRSLVKGHTVEHYSETKGFTLSGKAFGIDAIRSLAKHEKVKNFCAALFREDPAFAKLADLVASRDGVDAVKNGILFTAALWNQAAEFSSAFNEGKLGNAITHHFGITDKDGNFHPKITLSVEFFKEKTRWTVTAPSQIFIQGNLTWEVDEQVYQGVKLTVTENAEFIGRRILATFEADTFSRQRKGISPSVSFGPDGVNAGIDYQQSSAHQRVHHLTFFNIGKKLTVLATQELALIGAFFEALKVYVKTPKLKMATVQNTSSQKHLKAGVSTAPSVSFAIGRQSESQTAEATAIKARQEGLVDADNIFLKGAGLHNLEVKTTHIEHEDIVDVQKGHAFSLSLKLPEKDKFSGINALGDIDYRSNHKETKIRPTISGGNGHQFNGINTDPAKQREVVKDNKLHIGAPIVTMDFAKLQAEAQQIAQAFAPLPPPPAHSRVIIEEKKVVQPIQPPKLPAAAVKNRAPVKQAEAKSPSTPDPLPSIIDEIFQQRSAEPLEVRLSDLFGIHTMSDSSVAENLSTDDGSIGPITNFLMTPPPEFIYDLAVKLIKKAFGTNSVGNSQLPNALILSANSDYNGAFKLRFMQQANIEVVVHKELERLHNADYKRMNNRQTLCQPIDEGKAKGRVYELLELRGHGDITGIRLDTHEYLTVNDPLPSDSCLKNLSPNATIIVRGCSTGKGRENVVNLANHIACYAPENARIFAPTEDATHMRLTNKHPIEVEFRSYFWGDMTYKIDASNRERACKAARISDIPREGPPPRETNWSPFGDYSDSKKPRVPSKNRLDKAIEFAFLANEREDDIENRVAMGIAVNIPKKVFEKVCASHPLVQSGCKKVGLALQKVGNFTWNQFLPLLPPDAEKNRAANILKDAHYKNERTNIPIQATLNYHHEMAENVAGFMYGLPLVTLGSAIHKLAGRAKNPVKPQLKLKIDGIRKSHLLNDPLVPLAANANKKQIVHTIDWNAPLPAPKHSLSSLRKNISAFLKDESGSLPINKKNAGWRDMVELFEGIGYKIVPGGGKGSHIKLARPNSPMAIVPREKEISRGSMGDLIRAYKKAKEMD